jgi:hypothetical protein
MKSFQNLRISLPHKQLPTKRCNLSSFAANPTHVSQTSLPLVPIYSTKSHISAKFYSSFSSNFKPPTDFPFNQQQQKFGLDRIVDVELLQQETPQKITSIWVQHHHKKPCISAVVPSETFEKLKERYSKWCAHDHKLLRHPDLQYITS